MLYKQNYFLILFMVIHCWYIAIQLIFVYWYCIPWLYWASLWILIVFAGFLRILYIQDWVSANTGSLILSFRFECLSLPFSCLIILIRTSNTMLNRSGESRHSYLIPDPRRKVVFYFIYILTVVFSLESLYQIEEGPFHC